MTNISAMSQLCWLYRGYSMNQQQIPLNNPSVTDLCEWLWPSFNGEFCVTEFTVAGVGGGKPLLQAAFVHFPQRARAIARWQQGFPPSSFVTNPTHANVAVQGKSKENKQDSNETNDKVTILCWLGPHAGSSPSNLCKLTALTTVESGRPSFAVTLAMYWACVVESDSSESLDASDSAFPE